MTTPPTPNSQDTDGGEMDVNAVVSYNLRAIRRHRGMTQDDVADALARLTGHRLPQASISAMERGFDSARRRVFDAHELYLLSVVFRVPILYFFLPPPGESRRLAQTHRPPDDLYAAALGRDDQLADLDARLADPADPDQAANVIAALTGHGNPPPTTWRQDYRAWRDQRLAQITRSCDSFDDAVQALGAFLDQLRRAGLRSFVTTTDRTTPMPTPNPRTPTFVDPGRREPLDPIDPGPDQVCLDLTDWAPYRVDAVRDRLCRSYIDHLWDDGLLVFYAADQPQVTDVLQRFRDAARREVIEYLDHAFEDDRRTVIEICRRFTHPSLRQAIDGLAETPHDSGIGQDDR